VRKGGCLDHLPTRAHKEETGLETKTTTNPISRPAQKLGISPVKPGEKRIWRRAVDGARITYLWYLFMSDRESFHEQGKKKREETNEGTITLNQPPVVNRRPMSALGPPDHNAVEWRTPKPRPKVEGRNQTTNEAHPNELLRLTNRRCGWELWRWTKGNRCGRTRRKSAVSRVSRSIQFRRRLLSRGE